MTATANPTAPLAVRRRRPTPPPITPDSGARRTPDKLNNRIPQVDHEEMADVWRFRSAVEGDHRLFDSLILHRRAIMLAKMFRPRANEEGLAVNGGIFDVHKHGATECPIPQACMPQMKHCGAKFTRVGGIDAVFDRNQHRSIGWGGF